MRAVVGGLDGLDHCDRGEARRVLVVEDERKGAPALRDGLSAQGYEVAVADDGEAGPSQLQGGAFALLDLDLMLPKRDGFEALSAMRRGGIATPVLVLSARNSIEDRIVGLDKDAADDLIKPFAFPEFLPRIRTLLGRGGPHAPMKSAFGDLQLDVMSRRATCDNSHPWPFTCSSGIPSIPAKLN